MDKGISDRFVVLIIHIYLGFRHAMFMEEAEEMYNDYVRGRRARRAEEKKARFLNGRV